MNDSLPPSSPTRLRLLIAGSATLMGAVLVAAMLRMTEPKEAKVIVIEREPSALSDADSPAAQIEQPGSLQPAAASTPAPKAATAKPLPPHNAAAPDPALLTSSFAREQPRIQRCFASHGQASAASGDITVEFRVDTNGGVEDAQLSPPSAAAGPLGSCLIGIAKATHFPRLTRAVTFRIPIQARISE